MDLEKFLDDVRSRYNIRTCILTENDCYKRNRKIRPLGIMVHSTGADNPYLFRYVQPDDGRIGKNRYGNDWNRPNLPVCVHAVIGKLYNGDVATYQTLPWNHRGWHCGAEANGTHISFEMCEDDMEKPSKEYFRAAYRKATQLTAYLCELYNLDPMGKDENGDYNVVICHKEGHDLGIASNHMDVEHWFSKFGVTMNDFRQDVEKIIEEDFKMLFQTELTSALSKINAAEQTAIQAVTDSGNKNVAAVEKAVETVENMVLRVQKERTDELRQKGPSEWAAESWKKAKDGGIIKGMGGGVEAPRDTVTREQLVEILGRLGLLDKERGD